MKEPPAKKPPVNEPPVETKGKGKGKTPTPAVQHGGHLQRALRVIGTLSDSFPPAACSDFAH